MRSAAPGPAPMKWTVTRRPSVAAMAQVAGPTTRRGTTSVASGPHAASAAASATEGMPNSSFTRGEDDCVRGPAASSSPGLTRTSCTPRPAAASMIPASLPFPSEVAIAESLSGA